MPANGVVQYPGQEVSLVPTLVIRGPRLYPLIKVYRSRFGPTECVSFYKIVADRLGALRSVQ